jgi:hypothetical protein
MGEPVSQTHADAATLQGRLLPGPLCRIGTVERA